MDNTSSLCSIDLDVAHDAGGHPDSHAAWVAQTCKDLGLSFTLLQEVGPAGGNPLYRFTGPRHLLTILINNHFFATVPGDDHCEFLLERLRPE